MVQETVVHHPNGHGTGTEGKGTSAFGTTSTL